MLQEKCKSYLSHQIRGKPASVGEMLAQEQGELYPLPGYPFDPCKRTSGRVDRFCTVRFDTNNYSIPAAYCGKEVSVKTGPEMVWIYCGGKCISQHQRCLDRRQAIYKLEHYLPLLEKEGRAIFYAKPVQDALPGYFLISRRTWHIPNPRWPVQKSVTQPARPIPLLPFFPLLPPFYLSANTFSMLTEALRSVSSIRWGRCSRWSGSRCGPRSSWRSAGRRRSRRAASHSCAGNSAGSAWA